MADEYKIAVIGGRVASLACAMSLAEAGCVVELYSPRPVERYAPSGSVGINAAMDPWGEGDSPEKHAEDSLAASGGKADAPFIREMCEKAPRIINLLDRLGVPFDRTMDGRVDFSPAPHSEYRRMAHAGDATGRHIHRVLCDQARRWEKAGGLVKRTYREVVDFILDANGACIGLVFLGLKSMRFQSVGYDAVVLAGGGPSAVFGDAGTIADDFGPMLSAFPLGAKWVNPHLFLWGKEEDREMEAGCRDDAGRLVRRCLGGLRVDGEYGTDIPRLYAAGECEWLGDGEGVLPGNELLMDLHAGLSCAGSVMGFIGSVDGPRGELDSFIVESTRARSCTRLKTLWKKLGGMPGDTPGEESAYRFKRSLTCLMRRTAGPGRNAETLREADASMRDEMRPRFMKLKPGDAVSYGSREYLTFHHLALLLPACEVIVKAALKALESGDEKARIVAEWPDEGLVVGREEIG